MPDPNIARQISGLEDMRRSAQRSIDNLNQQIRLLERQDQEAGRQPNAGRVQSRIRDQIRQARRDMDAAKQNIKTFERQISDLKRMR